MNRKKNFSELSSKLIKREEQNQLRTLNVYEKTDSSSFIEADGREFINFSSNDYLGLSSHPKIIQKSTEYLKIFGAGSCSSRLITGTFNYHQKLENKIAEILSRESVLLFNSGFQANSTILPAVTSKSDIILADKFCHNSMIQGSLLSSARMYRYNHNDLEHLEYFLKRESGNVKGSIWIVSESLFSMGGDLCLLPELLQLAREYGAKTYIDDAHAFGVIGKHGLGLTYDYQDIDIVIGTFGKAAGSFGAFMASNEIIARSVVNFCAGFIYSTSLPPSVVGSIDAAIDLIPNMGAERERIQSISAELRSSLNKIGFTTGNSQSHIIPLITGGDAQALKLSEKFMQSDILVKAIRPPTVPESESRLRFSITAGHTEKHILQLLSVLKNES